MPMAPPIETVHLFAELSQQTLALLRSLDAEDWQRATTSSQRTVKDIAAHLLDGTLRRLSLQRDAYIPPEGPTGFDSYESLLAFLGELNRTWTDAARRLSPRLLVELLSWADPQLAEFFAQLDPHGQAPFAVAWAGQSESPNWFDVAREFSEKWHHAQQLFEATGRPSTITCRRLFHPCLDTFLRALPHTYRQAAAPPGTGLQVRVQGDAGGTWNLLRSQAAWSLVPALDVAPRATVSLDGLSLWRLATKRREWAAAEREFTGIVIEGDRELGRPFFGLLAMMA